MRCRKFAVNACHARMRRAVSIGGAVSAAALLLYEPADGPSARTVLSLVPGGIVGACSAVWQPDAPAASLELAQRDVCTGVPVSVCGVCHDAPRSAVAARQCVASAVTSAAGLGAGAGNTPLEVFVAVLDRMEVDHGVDLYKIMDVAEDLVVPLMDQPIRLDRDALTLGYAGVYSSFLLFAQRASEKYGVPSRDILVEMGRRKTVGGQEDMIEDVALDMAKAKQSS